MKRSERLAAIRRMADERHQIELSELSKLFDVSVVTIRKDADILQQRHCIRRVHGAIVSLADEAIEKNDAFKRLSKPDQKKEKIGRISAELIDRTGWIFIGQGTTCYHVAKELAKIDGVNVLTNNLLAAEAMTQNDRTNVVVTGGNLIHSHLYLAGEIFQRNMVDLHISCAFMGVGGIDQYAGYTVNYSSELTVFDAVQKESAKLILVADSSKFGKKCFLSLGGLNYANTVITDEKPSEVFLSVYQRHGVKVLY